jgi:phosphatidylserine decarboxylase
LAGLPIIAFTAFATLIFTLMGCWPMGLIGLIATFFVLYFFRDPERVVPQDEDVAVSPADGKVIEVDRQPDPISGEQRQRVCVFMNIFNVHVNRLPVAGEVSHLDYHPGKNFKASLDKASSDNERNIIRIQDQRHLGWTCVQIAGLLARRIVCFAEVGDRMSRGQRFGLIKFGSRLDLYLPQGYESSVTKGTAVFAGQTVVARRSGSE